MFFYGFACAFRFGVFPAFTVGIFAITPSATLPPVWISSREGTCQTDKRRSKIVSPLHQGS